jgi:hypothetical protein
LSDVKSLGNPGGFLYPKKVETLPDICLVLQTQLGPAKKEESLKFALDTLTLQTEVFKGL